MGRIDLNREKAARGADLAPALNRIATVMERAMDAFERSEAIAIADRARFDAATTLGHAPAKKGH